MRAIADSSLRPHHKPYLADNLYRLIGGIQGSHSECYSAERPSMEGGQPLTAADNTTAITTSAFAATGAVFHVPI
jgi:hypothetical protein